MDDPLRAKLAKLHALFERAGTAGERAAAGAAIGRVRERMRERGGEEPAIELKLSLPDGWSVRLFVAVCRKYRLTPYRYPRQRRTTVMVRAPKRMFETIVWVEFCRLQDELVSYFEETADFLIRTAMHADGDDSTLEAVPLPPS